MKANKDSTALSHIFWVFCLLGQYFSIRVSSETALSHSPCVIYWSGTESNTNGQVPTALCYISWVLNSKQIIL